LAKRSRIPIIDLFAGPGGLGEGFSSLRSENGDRLFSIALSVEADAFAHRTLELRAFYRQFDDSGCPDAYYDYVRNPTSAARDALFATFPAQASRARAEAWHHRLSLESAEQVTARVRTALGRRRTWVLIGGPPCQAYSLAGRSRRTHDDSFEADEKHTLYRHYLRIIEDLAPPVFVMENVKGILSAKIDKQSTIDRVLSDLRSAGPGYTVHSFVRAADDPATLRPSDFVIRAEDHGIPQARHRVILLGVRRDLTRRPSQLGRYGRPVSVGSVIGDLPRLRSSLSHRCGARPDGPEAWIDALRQGLAAMPEELTAVATAAVLEAEHGVPSLGRPFSATRSRPSEHAAWYKRDAALGGITNHNSRSHMASDLRRYLFCASFARVHHRSPVLADFPDELLPAHANVVAGAVGTDFADRFRVQIADRPSTTITSHISKDGHYYIHDDPSQCRSLSVREAARLQTFPDDYFFEGNRTQQYHQVGNAVPPLLARQLAAVVAKVLGRRPEDALPRADSPADRGPSAQ